MAERFLHTFDEWMVRVNKRLTALERRKAPPGAAPTPVPDPLTIGTINVSAKATVPAPLDPTDATTKEYVDNADAATLAAAKTYADSKDATTLASAKTYADTVAAAAQAAATQHLVAGDGVTVAGTGSAASPWVVTATGADAPTAWQDVTFATPFRGLGTVDLWQVRMDGDMGETSQILIAVSVTTSFTGGSNYLLGTLPAAYASVNRRGIYTFCQLRGTVLTSALVYMPQGTSEVRMLVTTTTTLTAGSGAQYLQLDPQRWVVG